MPHKILLFSIGRLFAVFAVAVLLYGPSPAFAALNIGQVNLYFMDDGKRTETTASMGDQGVKVYADIQVEGNGQLEGYWEVDGRRLENVSRRINFKQKLTLNTSRVPGTPSFEPGLHRVRFVVTSPAITFTTPTVTYFVSGAISGELPVVDLKKPGEGALVKTRTTFKWSKLSAAKLYILTVYEEDSKQASFSAMVEKNSYKLAAQTLESFFKPGESYSWKVTGVDKEGEILGESEVRTFRMME